jgi:hypothetical protein
MIRLSRIEQLPPEDRVKAYRELAHHFGAMAALAHRDGTKLAFEEMARQMHDRADAVTEFAA